VRYPATPEDNDVAELMIGEEQGQLLALRGSDDETLRGGNKALDEVIEKHAEHPLATYARYVKGVNAARTFKTIEPATPKRLKVREADLDAAETLLSAANAETSRLDNRSKAQGLDRLAAAQHASGDTAEASRTERLATELRSARSGRR
jgi:hypothetical protein